MTPWQARRCHSESKILLGFYRNLSLPKVDKLAKRKHETNLAKEEAIFVLLYRRPLTHQAIRFDALAGLVGRPETVRTGKLADMTLALGHGIRKPVEKALRFIRSIAE